MKLQAGARIGAFEIVALIGSGGMGEVYRARDTRLGRTVAIKVLRDDVITHLHRDRFNREASTISRLSHAHICTLYDLGRENDIDFLVMEYLEGETLATRLGRGPLPIDEALRYAIEIADALHAAHRIGIVHRDLKPGNVMLTRSGTHLLDFGLAIHRASLAAGQGETITVSVSHSSTDASVAGTVPYMAPEALEGRETDARTDLFAFGAMLYEIVTGERAFGGRSQASIIAAVLTSRPPPMSSHRVEVPPALDELVQVCLERDLEDRWQTARDLWRELKRIQAGRTGTGVAEAARPRASRWPAVAAVVTAVAASSTLTYWAAGALEGPGLGDPIRASIVFPSEHRLMTGPTQTAVSPNGRHLAYVAESEGESHLYLRPVGDFGSRQIAGTEGALTPFFSPDSAWVGFYSDGTRTEAGSGTLSRVSVSGGRPIVLGTVPRDVVAADWGPDGTIVFQSLGQSGLELLSAVDRTVQPLTSPDASQGEIVHGLPAFAPDGDSVFFTILTEQGLRAAVVSLATNEWRRFDDLGEAIRAKYLPSGHLLYAQSGGLLVASPYDLSRHATSGPAVQVASGIQSGVTYGAPHFTVSDTGVLAYVPEELRSALGRLVWVDQQGRPVPLTSDERPYGAPKLSPDGRRVVVDIGSSAGPDLRDLRVLDLDTGVWRNLPGGGVRREHPIWNRQGTQITYSAHGEIYSVAADGTSLPERLIEGEALKYPSSWSPEGVLCFYEQDLESGTFDLWSWTPGGDPAPLWSSPDNERSPQFSPDGRALAFVSDRSGQDEVYVVPFPNISAPPARVSNGGGGEPAWSRNGQELFYRQGDQMMVAPIATEPTLRADPPRQVFTGTFATEPARQEGMLGDVWFSVDPTAERFLMILRSSPRVHVNLIFNWFDEVRRLAPPS